MLYEVITQKGETAKSPFGTSEGVWPFSRKSIEYEMAGHFVDFSLNCRISPTDPIYWHGVYARNNFV